MITISPIKELDPNIKYKRRIWAGVRNSTPIVTEYVYIGSKTTFQEDLINEGLYPSLIVWEKESGERQYGEVVNPNR